MYIGFVCNEENELYKIYNEVYDKCLRFDSEKEAVDSLDKNSSIFIFEDEFPLRRRKINESFINKTIEKNIKVLIEYPKSVFNIDNEKVIALDRERLINNATLAISQNNSQYIIPYKIDSSNVIVSYGKVAGYRKAVYGLPIKAYPYLFIHPLYKNIMIVSSSVSMPIKSRYKPLEFWHDLYKTIFKWITNSDKEISLSWEEDVKVMYPKHYDVKEKDIAKSRLISYEWFKKFMVHIDYKGRKVYEGFSSGINYEGKQQLAKTIRLDCCGEATLLFSINGILKKNNSDFNIARELMEFVFLDYNQEKNMKKIDGGFIKWASDDRKIFYTDDNARILLGVMPSLGMLKSSKWNEDISKCILAFVRTINKKNIHMNSLRYKENLVIDNWDLNDIVSKMQIEYSPHYVSYIWAVFLIAYGLTKDKQLLDIAKKGIYEIMDKYPENWKWTNGIMAEVSRMILPLAMLYRYDNDSRTKEMLDMLIMVVEEQMQDSGAMLEKMTYLENGKYPPPKSNDEYGKYEAPIIHEDKDPACDLLYSQNFAYIGLHEAYLLTREKRYKNILDKMTSFFVKIQTKSMKFPELHGSWMRSFDNDIWEYWGSGADSGWAAYCIESGWTNTWINCVLGLRELDKSIVDYTNDIPNFSEDYYRIKKETL